MAYLSSEDLHAAASALAAAPLAQEFCLLCFFCLGFLLCRTSVVKRLLSLERLPRIGSGTLLQLHQQRRYEEVLDAWPTLEDFTPQAFSAVVDALLALDRPEDVGLFFYKATVNLRHLRSSLHESIGKIEQSQVPLERISVALREVFENREPLDVRAWQELLVAFAKTNDTTYADALLDLCPEPLPLDILRRSVEGFLSCSNLEAAIRYLQKAEELHGLEGHFQDLVAETAYAVEADVEDQRLRMCTLLALGGPGTRAVAPGLTACALRVAAECDGGEELYHAAVSSWQGPGTSLELLEAFVKASAALDAPKGMEILRAMGEHPEESLLLEQLWAQSHGQTRQFLKRVQRQRTLWSSEEPSPEELSLLVSGGDADRAEDRGGEAEDRCEVLARGGYAEAKQRIEGGGARSKESLVALMGEALAQGDRDYAYQLLDIEGDAVDARSLSVFFQAAPCGATTRTADFDRAMEVVSRHWKKMDEGLVNVMLEACVGLRDSQRLNQVLSFLKRCNWELPPSWSNSSYSALIKALGSTQQMHKAQELWQKIQQQGIVPNEHMFAQMIDVLVTGRKFQDALKLFQEMQQIHTCRIRSSGVAMAYAMIVKGYTQQKDAASALRLYEEMKAKGVQVGVVVLNTLIDACCRTGDLAKASCLLDDMADFELCPDLITYSTLIKGHCAKGDLDKALELFGAMRRRGIKPDAIVFNSLLDGGARKELHMLCEQVVNDMIAAGVPPSNYSASILIKLYGRISDLDAAFKVLEEMPRKFGFRPNAAVYTTLMSSCTWNGRMDLALALKNRMIQDGQLPDEKTYSTLLRGAMRSGQSEQIAALLWEALEQGEARRCQLLADDVAQNALQSMSRRASSNLGAEELLQRLRAAGYEVRRPQGKTSHGHDRSRRTKC